MAIALIPIKLNGMLINNSYFWINIQPWQLSLSEGKSFISKSFFLYKHTRYIKEIEIHLEKLRYLKQTKKVMANFKVDTLLISMYWPTFFWIVSQHNSYNCKYYLCSRYKTRRRKHFVWLLGFENDACRYIAMLLKWTLLEWAK